MIPSSTHFILLWLRKTVLAKLLYPRAWTYKPLITSQERKPIYISLFPLCYTDVHYEIDFFWIYWNFVHYTREKVTNNNLNTCLPQLELAAICIWKMNNSTNIFQGTKWMKFWWISSINVISPLGFSRTCCVSKASIHFLCVLYLVFIRNVHLYYKWSILSVLSFQLNKAYDMSTKALDLVEKTAIKDDYPSSQWEGIRQQHVLSEERYDYPLFP